MTADPAAIDAPIAGGREAAIPFAGGLVVLEQGGARLRSLNAGAAAIWSLLGEGFSAEEAAALLAEHGGRSIAEARADIASFRAEWSAAEAAPEGLGHRPRTRAAPSPPRFYGVAGATISLAGEDQEVAERVEAALADRATARADGALALHVRVEGDAMHLLVDGEPWLRSAESGEIVGGVFHRLLERAHPHADWLAMMHAAALGRDGAAILIPGKSGAGKTTLTAHLARRGWTYLSDDLAAIDAAERVVAWPTPPSIKRGSWRVLADAYPELEALPERDLAERRVKLLPTPPAAWDQPPLTVRALVLPHWQPDAACATRRLEPAEALAALIEDRLWLGDPITRGRAERFLAWLERTPAWRLTYSTLAEAEAAIAAL